MSKSPAEIIYNSWATKPHKLSVLPQALKSGAFQKFLDNKGFKPVIDGLVKLYQKNGLTSSGQRKTVEQIWKVLDKFTDRHGEVIALELLKVISKEPSLQATLDAFATHYTPSITTPVASQNKINAARATWLKLARLYFPRVDKTIQIVKMLGKGGMGGAVYLGVDTKGKKYAVKHFPGKYKPEKYNTIDPTDRELKKKILYDWDEERQRFKRNKNTVREKIYLDHTGELLTPKEARERVNAFLLRYAEGAQTTTCFDVIQRGADQYLLLELGEGDVDYTDITMADIVNIYRDLHSLENYSQNHMQVHLTQDIGLLHLDIHGGNLMRFNGRMRFIDFGMALVYNPKTVERFGRIKERPWAELRRDPEFYLVSNQVEDSLKFSDPTRGSAEAYISDWRSAYGVMPKVKVCRACSRQHPDLSSITKCLFCDSTKLELADLRKVDLESLAKIKGKDSFDLLVRPYKDATVARITPVQYGCIVLTAVLIKEIWAAVQKKKNMDFGLGTEAKAIVNVNVYSKARRLFPRFRAAAPESALLIGLLLSWFDVMMKKLFAGDLFTALDAVKYFDRGGSRPQRGRSAEI